MIPIDGLKQDRALLEFIRLDGSDDRRRELAECLAEVTGEAVPDPAGPELVWEHLVDSVLRVVLVLRRSARGPFWRSRGFRFVRRAAAERLQQEMVTAQFSGEAALGCRR